MKKITLLFAIAMISMFGHATIYVVPNGAGTADGSSWENAYSNIQTAIDAASALYTNNATPQEVWIKAGTYSTASAALLMKESVSLYGGFSGVETDKNQRVKGVNPWDYTNTTILNGGGTKRCIEATANFANVTVIDGITITNGNGAGTQLTGNGGGVLLRQNIKLQNCIVTGNTTAGNGGGVNAVGGIVSYCWIYSNTNTNGTVPAAGGVYSAPGTGLVTLVENSIIERNTQGGVRFQGLGSMTMNGCIIRNNTSTANGAAIYTNNPAVCNITNCLITNNSGNGAIYLNKGKLINCTVANNEGGIYLASATNIGEVYNNIVVNNVVKGTSNPVSISVTASYPAGKVLNNATWPSVAYQTWGHSTDSILTESAANALSQVAFTSPTSFAGRVLANADSLNMIAAADWTLSNSSLCLDKGNNSLIPSGIVKDFVGNNRIDNFIVDLGAFEKTNSITTDLIKNKSGIKCIGLQQSLEIQGLTAGDMVYVYNVTGSSVASKQALSSQLSLTVPAGMYIVKAGNQVNKIIVK